MKKCILLKPLFAVFLLMCVIGSACSHAPPTSSTDDQFFAEISDPDEIGDPQAMWGEDGLGGPTAYESGIYVEVIQDEEIFLQTWAPEGTGLDITFEGAGSTTVAVVAVYSLEEISDPLVSSSEGDIYNVNGQRARMSVAINTGGCYPVGGCYPGPFKKDLMDATHGQSEALAMLSGDEECGVGFSGPFNSTVAVITEENIAVAGHEIQQDYPNPFKSV